MRLDDDLKYFESPEFKDILGRYETARAAGQSLYMDADELTDVAEYYAMALHDEDRANEALALALRLHPDAVDPQVFQARQCMLDGDTHGAMELCDGISDQSHREVHFLRAELLVRLDRAEEALRYLLREADAVDEDRDYFLYDAAYIFVDYNDYDRAHHLARELEQMAPVWFKTWELRADVALGLEQHEQALTYIERMLDRDPFYLDAWNWRCEACCGLQDYTRALESTDFALAVEPQDERALELRAWVLMRQESYTEAHDLYTRLQAMNPDSEMHCLYDSYCLFDLQRYDEALRLIRRAEELADGMSPEQAAIFEHHAHLLSELGEPQQALAYIDRAEQALDTDTDSAAPSREETAQDFDYYRARIYAENGDSDTALQYLEQIARRGREPLPSVILQGAQILFEAGDFETALPLLQQLDRQLSQGAAEEDAAAAAVEADVRLRLLPYLAACYHETGDDRRCLATLRRAVDAQAPELREVLGYLFADGVQPAEYYDYYFYRVHGRWPQGQ